MQLNIENKNIEIMTDYESRKTVTLEDIFPNWWGKKRYNEKSVEKDEKIILV